MLTGLTGFSWRTEVISTDDAIEVMKQTLEYKANFWNGGNFYGTREYNSLHILKAYFEKYPEDKGKVVISIKGGTNPATHNPDASPDNIKKEIDYCLEMLGDTKLDIFEAARVDPKVPIEETVKAIQEYVDAGKVGGVALSEVSAESIRRAAKAIAPAKIAAVEVELSLFSTDIFTNGIAQACADLEIPIVAYSPLGRGFLVSTALFPSMPK